MPISARNQLRGTIQQLVLGNVMAHVVVRVGENVIESVITRRSGEELKLKQGDTVTAIIKATEVMIQTDCGRPGKSAPEIYAPERRTQGVKRTGASCSK